jgi:4-diphosphocytidyl-2-C-methyl-D-erythritol kinase
MADASPVAEFAAAKINLWLHVTGRRADGYHLLDSLIAFAGTGDRLRFDEADTLSLAIDGPFGEGLGSSGDNLIIKAAWLLAAEAGVKPGARIRLEKNLPVASGIGGGSADAAAALRGLARLWKLAVPRKDMARLALRLGADVPMCLDGRAAFAGGIGEELVPVSNLAPAWLVLVNPRFSLSTPEVFRNRQGDFTVTSRPDPAELATPAGLAAALSARRNDLQPPAVRLAPVIGQVLSALRAAPGALFAAMSGSGATCFALFDGEAPARKAAAELALEAPGWWIAPAPLLSGGGE